MREGRRRDRRRGTHAVGADRAPGRGDARRAHGGRRGRAELTFAEYKAAAERAAAGLARLGIGAGDVVTWQLPTWLESMVLVAALGPPRRDPEPDAADLPRARGRLHRPPGRAQAARRAVGVAGFDFEAMANEIAGRGRRPRGARLPTGRCPQGDPSHAAAAAATPDDPGDCRCAGSSTRRARRPTRRARSTPTAPSSPRRPGMGARLELTRRRSQRARLPVHPHRRHRLAVLEPHRRHGPPVVEAFVPDDGDPVHAARAT